MYNKKYIDSSFLDNFFWVFVIFWEFISIIRIFCIIKVKLKIKFILCKVEYLINGNVRFNLFKGKFRLYNVYMVFFIFF